jgi:hypothetical protein
MRQDRTPTCALEQAAKRYEEFLGMPTSYSD